MQGASTLLALAFWAGSVAAQSPPSRDDLATLLARGDSAWTREDHPAAFTAYDAVVRADSVYSTRALFRVGLLHAWSNRFGAAIAAQRRYIRAEPDDLEGRVALGRTYAWASRIPESLAQYDSVLARDANYRDAVLGRAQTLAWSDRIPEGEATLERWVERRADDTEAWTLLGQFRRWRGETRAAEQALTRALAIAPNDRAAREQMAWVKADLNLAATFQMVGAKDSERNTLWHREVGVLLPMWHGVRAGATARLREASVSDVDAIVVPGALIHASWRPAALGITWRADFGAVSFPSTVPGETLRLRGGVRGAGVVGGKLRLSAGGNREPFDEVLSTASRGLMFSVFDVDANYILAPRWHLGLSGTAGVVDGSPDVIASRSTIMGSLRFLPRRGTQLSLSQRQVSWDAPEFGVFFAPQTWSITEAALSWERPAELGLVLAGDLALASQGVAFESNPVSRSVVPRGAMRVGYRVAPGRELVFGLVYANVAGAGAITASDYRYGAATLTGRWTF